MFPPILARMQLYYPLSKPRYDAIAHYVILRVAKGVLLTRTTHNNIIVPLDPLHNQSMFALIHPADYRALLLL